MYSKSAKSLLVLVLSSLALNVSASVTAPAAPLVRSVKVIEGTETNLYVGNQVGQTLYTFDPDSNGKSVCDGTCAEQWPPFVITSAEASTLMAPLGVITRNSGLLQLTINGSPVYTYFANRVEGDDKGDGIGGVWHDIDFK